jgi:hypothetical protein
MIQTKPCSSNTTRADDNNQPPILQFMNHFNSGLARVIAKAAGELIDDEEIIKHRQASRYIYRFQDKPHD